MLPAAANCSDKDCAQILFHYTFFGGSAFSLAAGPGCDVHDGPLRHVPLTNMGAEIVSRDPESPPEAQINPIHSGYDAFTLHRKYLINGTFKGTVL